jgi:hypothetical protein
MVKLVAKAYYKQRGTHNKKTVIQCSGGWEKQTELYFPILELIGGAGMTLANGVVGRT